VRTRARASAMGAPVAIADAPHPGAGPCPPLRTLTPHAAPLAQALRDARVALAHGGRSHPHAHPLSRATTFITLWDL